MQKGGEHLAVTDIQKKANLYMQGSLKSFHESRPQVVSGLNKSGSTISQNRGNASQVTTRQKTLHEMGIFSAGSQVNPEDIEKSQDPQFQNTLQDDHTLGSMDKGENEIEAIINMANDQYSGELIVNASSIKKHSTKQSKPNDNTKSDSSKMQKSYEHVTLQSRNMTMDGGDEQATPKLYSYTPDDLERHNINLKTAKMSNVSISGIFNKNERRQYGGHSVGSTATGGNTQYNKNMLMKAYYQKLEKSKKQKREMIQTISQRSQNDDLLQKEASQTIMDQQFQKIQKQMMKQRAQDNPFIDFVQEQLSYKVTLGGYKPTKVRQISPLQLIKKIQHGNTQDVNNMFKRNTLEDNKLQQINELSLTNRKTGNAQIEEIQTWQHVLETQTLPNKKIDPQIKNNFELRNRESNFLRKMKMDQKKFAERSQTKPPSPVKKIKLNLKSSKTKRGLNTSNLVINEDSQIDSLDEQFFEKSKRTMIAKTVVKGARREQEQQVSSFGDTLSVLNKTLTVFNQRRKTLEPIKQPPAIVIPSTTKIIDQVKAVRTNYLQKVTDEIAEKQKLRSSKYSGIVTELIVKPQSSIKTPASITPLRHHNNKDSNNNSSNWQKETYLGDMSVTNKNRGGNLLVNTVQGSPLRSQYHLIDDKTPHGATSTIMMARKKNDFDFMALGGAFAKTRGTFKQDRDQKEKPTNHEFIAVVGKTFQAGKKSARPTLNQKSRTKPIDDSQEDLSSGKRVQADSKEVGEASEIGAKEILLDQTQAYSSLESNQKIPTGDIWKAASSPGHTHVTDEKMVKIGQGVLPVQMFDSKVGEKMLDKILSQNQISKRNSTERVSPSERTAELDESVNLKIHHEFGIFKKGGTLVRRRDNTSKQTTPTRQPMRREEQPIGHFKKGFKKKKQHFDFILSTPTAGNQSQTAELVVSGVQNNEVTTFGDNPLKVTKKVLKSIKQYTPVREPSRELPQQQRSHEFEHIEKCLTKPMDDNSTASKGKQASMSKSYSSQDRLKGIKKDHITSDTIIVTKSKRRRRSTTRNSKEMLINENDDIKKLIKQPKKKTSKKRFKKSKNQRSDESSFAASPRSGASLNQKKGGKKNDKTSSQQEARQILPQLEKLQIFINQSIDHQMNEQIMEIQMFKDMNLLPHSMANKDILKLLLENGMVPEEMIELDELKESCRHLIDIEQKLIDDVITLSKQQKDLAEEKLHNRFRKQLRLAREKLDEFRKSALIISDKISARLKQMGYDIGAAVKVKEMRLMKLNDASVKNLRSNNASRVNRQSSQNVGFDQGTGVLVPVEPPVVSTYNDNMIDVQSDQETENLDSRLKASGRGSPVHEMMPHVRPKYVTIDDNTYEIQPKEKKRTVSNDNLMAYSTLNTNSNPQYQTMNVDETPQQRQSPFQQKKLSSLGQTKVVHQKSQRVDFVLMKELSSNPISNKGSHSPKNSKSKKRFSMKERLESEASVSISEDQSIQEGQKKQVNWNHYNGNTSPNNRDQASKTLFETSRDQKAFQKKAQPVCMFRNEMDMAKKPDLQQRSVLKLLNEKSLNELGEKQFMISNRIKEISKLLTGKQMDKKMSRIEGKEQKITDQIMKEVYKNMPRTIESARSTSPQFNRTSSSQIHGSPMGNLEGLGNMQSGNKSRYISSLQYNQTDSLIIDNRLTSLFRDYYKVIGSRYKFKLEDLLIRQTHNKLIPSLENYMSFKQRLSAFNVLPTAETQPALRNYVKYSGEIGVPGEAKKKLASRQRRRMGAGEVEKSVAMFSRDINGTLVQPAAATASGQLPPNKMDRVSAEILKLIIDKYREEIYNPTPRNRMEMRSSMKEMETQRMAQTASDGLDISMTNVNVYPKVDHYHMDNLIKKYNTKLQKAISQSSPLNNLNRGDYVVSPGFTLERVEEDVKNEISKIVTGKEQSPDKVNPITAYKADAKARLEFESEVCSDKAQQYRSKANDLSRESSPKLSAKDIMTQRYEHPGHPESLKSLNLPENLGVLSLRHPSSVLKLTEGQQMASAVHIPEMHGKQLAKFKSIFETQRADQKIKIDDHFRPAGLETTIRDRADNQRQDGMTQQQLHQKRHSTKNIVQSSPRHNMLAPKKIFTEALEKQATPPDQLQQKHQIAKEIQGKKQNWDETEGYGKVGQLLKMTPSANLSSSHTPGGGKKSADSNQLIGALEGQKIQLKEKSEAIQSKVVVGAQALADKDSPIVKGSAELDEKIAIKAEIRRTSLISLDRNKRKLTDHGNLDDSESDEMESRKLCQQLPRKESSLRPSSTKKAKKSILLKTLHDKSSTKNLLHKNDRKDNADLSHVSDSPVQKGRLLTSGFNSPGKSTIKKKSHKFEFGGSSSKFFTDNNSPKRQPTDGTHANVSPGEKLTLLQRVASPIEQIINQQNNTNIIADALNIEIGNNQSDNQIADLKLKDPKAANIVSESPEIRKDGLESTPLDGKSQDVQNDTNYPTRLQKRDSGASNSFQKSMRASQHSEQVDFSKLSGEKGLIMSDAHMLTLTGKIGGTSGGRPSDGPDGLLTALHGSPIRDLTAEKPGELINQEHKETELDEFDSERIVAELNMFENQTIDPSPEEAHGFRSSVGQKKLGKVASNYENSPTFEPTLHYKPSKLSNHQMQSIDSSDQHLQNQQQAKNKGAGTSAKMADSVTPEQKQRNYYPVRGAKAQVFGGGFSRNQEGVQRAVKQQKVKEKSKKSGSVGIVIRNKEQPAAGQLPSSPPPPGSTSPTVTPAHVAPKATGRHPVYLTQAKNQLEGNPAKIAEAEEDFITDLSADSVERVRRLQKISESASAHLSKDASPQNATIQDYQHFIPAPEQQK